MNSTAILNNLGPTLDDDIIIYTAVLGHLLAAANYMPIFIKLKH